METLDLTGLTENDGWKALKARYEAQADGFGRWLTKSLMRGDEVDQRMIDYMRGAIEVAAAIFAAPDQATESLEKTAKRLYAKQLQEEVAAELAQSPYIE